MRDAPRPSLAKSPRYGPSRAPCADARSTLALPPALPEGSRAARTLSARLA